MSDVIIPKIKDLTMDNFHTLFEAGPPRKLIGQFLQHLTCTLVWPIDKQESAGMCPPGKFWCADWWTIETGKYFYLGHHAYINEPPPKRLRRLGFNPVGTVAHGIIKHKTVFALEKLKNEADQLLIAEVGRGLEIVCALLVKDSWDKIICYDVGDYSNSIHKFFSRYYKGTIEYHIKSNHGFKLEKLELLDKDTILLISHSRTKATDALIEYDHPHIKHIIHNGDIIK